MRHFGGPTYAVLAVRHMPFWRFDIRHIGGPTYVSFAVRHTSHWRSDIRYISCPAIGVQPRRPPARRPQDRPRQSGGAKVQAGREHPGPRLRVVSAGGRAGSLRAGLRGDETDAVGLRTVSVGFMNGFCRPMFGRTSWQPTHGAVQTWIQTWKVDNFRKTNKRFFDVFSKNMFFFLQKVMK